MGNVGNQRAERDGELDAEVAREIRDELAERSPAVVRLDADEEDRIAIRVRDARSEERVLGPLDLPRPPLLERHERTCRLEVDEQLGVDVGELPGPPEPREVAGGERRSLASVVPPAKRPDEHGPLER